MLAIVNTILQFAVPNESPEKLKIRSVSGKYVFRFLLTGRIKNHDLSLQQSWYFVPQLN